MGYTRLVRFSISTRASTQVFLGAPCRPRECLDPRTGFARAGEVRDVGRRKTGLNRRVPHFDLTVGLRDRDFFIHCGDI